MPKDREIKSEVWDKATEIIGDLPGVSIDGRNPDHLINESRLVSAVPQQKALERVGVPAAVYDEDGNRILGPGGFPEQITMDSGTSTRTTVGPHGELLMFQPVELEGKSRTLCLGLNGQQLHNMLPYTTPLTQAEFSVLAGLMNGQTLRDIAKADGVSYNTRRRQIETALAKLGVHSQVEAVRLTYVTLVDRLLLAMGEAEASRSGIAKLAKLYGDDVRFHWIHLSGSPPIRMVEIGDPAGRPVLLFSTFIFPCGPSPEGIADVRKAGFRVIIPFRPGFFDAPELSGRSKPAGILAAWSEQCNALLSFLNLDKVHIASVSFTAVWAADFARWFPDRVESMVFISAPQPSYLWHTQARTTSVFHSLASIIEKAPWLAKPIVRLHAAQMRSHKGSLKAWHRTYKNSPHDLADIELMVRDRRALEVMPLVIGESISGVANDLRVLLYPWENYVAGLDVPLYFVHGQHDQISPLPFTEKLTGSLPQAQLHIVEGKGHLLGVRSFGHDLTTALGP